MHPFRWICLSFPSTEDLDPDFCDFITISHPSSSTTQQDSDCSGIAPKLFNGNWFFQQLLSYKNNQTSPLVKQLQKFQKFKKTIPNFCHWIRAGKLPNIQDGHLESRKREYDEEILGRLLSPKVWQGPAANFFWSLNNWDSPRKVVEGPI